MHCGKQLGSCKGNMQLDAFVIYQRLAKTKPSRLTQDMKSITIISKKKKIPPLLQFPALTRRKRPSNSNHTKKKVTCNITSKRRKGNRLLAYTTFRANNLYKPKTPDSLEQRTKIVNKTRTRTSTGESISEKPAGLVERDFLLSRK